MHKFKYIYIYIYKTNLWIWKSNKMTDMEQEELRNERTINTGASDHVFKPKNKRRGGEKQQNRNFHEVEFQRLLLITGTFLSLALSLSASPAAIGFHNLKKAHAALLLPSPRCCCFSHLARPVTPKK